MFIAQGEYLIFSDTKNMLSNFTHPLILLGLLSQLILIYCIISKNPNKKINTTGVVLLTPVVVLFLVVGILSSNLKMIFSNVPFLLLVVSYFFLLKRPNSQ
jgi:hypothetical protein